MAPGLLLTTDTGKSPGVLTSPAFSVIFNCRSGFVLLTDEDRGCPLNRVVTVGLPGVPKKPPSMLNVTDPPFACATLSLEMPTIAARTGERTTWHWVGSGEHCCCVPLWRPAVTVSVTVFAGGVGCVDSSESGMRTRSTVLDAARTFEAGISTPLINTLVVEIKFVPVR